MANQPRRPPLSPELRGKLALLATCDGMLSPDQITLLNEVFSSIVEAHHKGVGAVLRRRGLTDHEVQDLVADTFEAMYHRIVEAGIPADLDSAFHDIAHRKVSSFLQAKHARRGHEEPGLPSSSAEPPQSLGADARAAELRATFHRVRASLPRTYVDVLDLVLIGRATHVEAARILGIPEGTVKTRLLAVRRALVAALRDEGDAR